METANSIDLVCRYLDRISENSANDEKVVDLILGLNRSFSVMTPDEKVTVLDYLVGRLIHCRSNK
jgi:hypothetical protein